MKMECLFCSSFQNIPLETGFVLRCSCGSYGVICTRNNLDDLRKKAAGFLGLASPYEVTYDYKVIFYSGDPLIILWMKRGPKQHEGQKD